MNGVIQAGTITGRVVRFNFNGVNGLPSGEGIVDIRSGTETRTVRLGGPGTNAAGTVTNAKFTKRALILLEAYCDNGFVEVGFKEFGASFPDITQVKPADDPAKRRKRS